MSGSTANDLIARFRFQELLNQTDSGKRVILRGTIDDQPALLLAERGAFTTEAAYLTNFVQLITNLRNLGANDIYHWYLANSLSNGRSNDPEMIATPPDLKINLIYPCTTKHIQKYSFQQTRAVVETPEIYTNYVRPYMSKCREEGRLNWVFNIIEGRSEQEDVLYRSHAAHKIDDYLLLPDLNWDRKTLGSLHLLALVERRDLWSVRDLKKKDVAWLRQLRQTLAAQVAALYPGQDTDMLKFYVHYQPTYYHFHIHIVHVNLDATGTQAVGKAIGLDQIIGQLTTLTGDAGTGLEIVDFAYTLGEASELWTEIYLPLKEGRAPNIRA